MIAVIEAILERQRPGFEALLSCDEATGACRFRRGWSLTEARPWLADAHPDTFGEGHWAALAFVVARFELAPAGSLPSTCGSAAACETRMVEAIRASSSFSASSRWIASRMWLSSIDAFARRPRVQAGPPV